MSDAVLVLTMAYLSVVLLLGLVALLRAQRADIPEVTRALGRWLRGK